MTYSDARSNLASSPNASAAMGAVHGAPRALLQIEGALLAAVAGLAFHLTGGSWLLFAVLFLVPDIFMLGYLLNRRLGALIYNLGHTTVLPVILVAIGWFAAVPLAVSIGLIWLAHVGFDRAVGYGFKYDDDFKHTHLGTPFSGRR